MEKRLFIAEVKTRSPYGFESEKSWDELFEIANEYGDWLSIQTDYRWGGSFDLLERARRLTNKPILARGAFSNDEEITRAVELGADKVSVVGRIPGVFVRRCILEPLDVQQLVDFPAESMMLWTQRELTTGRQKAHQFADARSLFGGWLAQASFIEFPEDVHRGANAFIVGERLVEYVSQL